MSDNNADFNGNGQINNPTSDDATQADFAQPYGAAQADARMVNQDTQLDTSAYDPNAAYGQPPQPTYDQSAYAQQPAQPAAPAYDPNAASYNQYAQPAQPAYAQPAAPAPAYDPNATYGQQSTQSNYGQQGYAAPAYNASGAYAQSNYAQQPNYAQANYGQANYSQTNYGQQAPAYTQSAYAQHPNYAQPVAPAGYSQKSKLAAGLLGIFLGSFGVHNFYLGNTGKAVAQLLLTLIGWIIVIGPAIAGIWGLIEGILILCSSYGSQWHRDGHGVELQD